MPLWFVRLMVRVRATLFGGRDRRQPPDVRAALRRASVRSVDDCCRRGVLAIIALLAALRPARSAAQLDPLLLLHHD